MATVSVKRSVTALATSAAALLALATPALASDVSAQAINLRTPFDCGQVWNANTRTNHNPQLSVDFQRSDANNKNVRSSAAGKVVTRRDLGNTSYGRYLVIDHGGGWQTLYAHLNSFNVSLGQSVSTGTIIGKVGSTGGSTGPHLHYEQKLNGAVQRVVLNGKAVVYYGNTSITSSTGC
ncbi:M23 family metallopeptidase [Allokutzneria oryzae]|uniref:M23 family metallopeptidase n=1 Tax=Allokutzneria oryzae TaxID=1378989 RepID=A0ABV6A5J3_9PSEU